MMACRSRGLSRTSSSPLRMMACSSRRPSRKMARSSSCRRGGAGRKAGQAARARRGATRQGGQHGAGGATQQGGREGWQAAGPLAAGWGANAGRQAATAQHNVAPVASAASSLCSTAFPAHASSSQPASQPAARPPTSFSILCSSSRASPMRSRSLLSTTKIRPCVFWK